ncbi:MAG: glycosyltransferase family 4 protein [Paludibacteraceae bacterium]|nr:glycosyltransferase family 4 protein [Paludibacteraceae bacterium]
MQASITIAFNASFLQPKGGGISEYIYNIITHLRQQDTQNRYIVYVLQDMEDYAREKLPKDTRIKVIPYASNYLGVIRRSLFSQRFWYEEERKEGFDIFHSPFFHAPKFKHARVILTVHDLRLYRFPSTYALPRLIYLYFVVRRSIRRADKIISISQFTKDEIISTCGVQADKITVIHEAINRDDFSEKRILPEDIAPSVTTLADIPFILSVGHLEPRKNYERLIEAFLQLKQRAGTERIRLVIVGKKAHHYKTVIKMIEENEDVVYLDFVSRSTLLWLYSHASLFAFPSFYEGFGFPPLEAACFDTISAVSNQSCIPEICGEAALYYNPFDTCQMAEQMYEGLFNEDVIAQQHKSLSVNLDRFSWEKNAKQTIETYQQLLYNA